MSLRPCTLLVFLLTSLVAACGTDLKAAVFFDPSSPSTADTDASDSGSASDTASVPQPGCSFIDFLLVIDNSLSMHAEQTNLAANVPLLSATLDAYAQQRDLVGYRVGVTTPGVHRSFSTQDWPAAPAPETQDGEIHDGALRGQEPCGLDEAWLDDTDPQFDVRLACMADVGLSGTRTEMPLAALELALGERSAEAGPNRGFYRGASSLLVVLIVTDEDDCSVEDGGLLVERESQMCAEGSKGLYEVSRTLDFLTAVTGGEDRYVVAVIAGDTDPRCQSSLGEAYYAPRLLDFVAGAGERGEFGSLCAADLSTALKGVLSAARSTCDALPPI